MNPDIFKNRAHAGQCLASELGHYADRGDVIVIGLPRGGVPVALEVAKALHAPLDVVVVRKLGVPGWEELAMGAIATGGVRVMNEDVLRSGRIPARSIEAVVKEQTTELHRRELAYRGHSAPPDVRHKVVILVDDGIATGATIRAAATAIRQLSPSRIVIAAPVGAPDTCEALKDVADEIIVPSQPDYFRAVGVWYEDFGQTTDDEVTAILTAAHRDDRLPRPQSR
jgi:predicted phosphoribosyltransferase